MNLAGIPEAVVLTLATALAVDGIPLRLYTRKGLPRAPEEPYVVVDPYPTGYGYDATLERFSDSGWGGLMFSAVGKADIDAATCLDYIRAQLRVLDLSTVILTGVAIRNIAVEELPSQPVESGGVTTITDTYLLYLEAA